VIERWAGVPNLISEAEFSYELLAPSYQPWNLRQRVLTNCWHLITGWYSVITQKSNLA
jgi:hypothetical protein